MKLEEIIRVLDEYLMEKTHTKINLVLYKSIIPNTTFKAYKEVEISLWLLKVTQDQLLLQGYDGISTPSLVTVFPSSVKKLKIKDKKTIEQFIEAHKEVEKWAPWSTDVEKMNNVLDRTKSKAKRFKNK